MHPSIHASIHPCIHPFICSLIHSFLPSLAGQALVARNIRQLEHGTIRGDAVGLVDYEKLKIELEELTKTIRARDKELPVLRSEASRASQVHFWMGGSKLEQQSLGPLHVGISNSQFLDTRDT